MKRALIAAALLLAVAYGAAIGTTISYLYTAHNDQES